MKFKLYSLIALLLIVGVATGCFRKTTTADTAPVGVVETGTIIDVTEKNGQTIAAVPGDVMYVKLTGEAASGKQWSVIKPITGSALELKDHKIVGLVDPAVLNGRFTDEWWLKILESGLIEVQFNYGESGKESETSFAITVNSQPE